MRGEELLISIKRRLQDMSIFNVRQVARAVGVQRATEGKKEDIIAAVLNIATGAAIPLKPTGRGAPPKSALCDEQLVSDILRCRMYSVSSEVNILKSKVSDGGYEKYAEGIIGYVEGVWYLITEDAEAPGYGLDDRYVSGYKLGEGDLVLAVLIRDGDGRFIVCGIIAVNGEPAEKHMSKSARFEALTHTFPQRRISLGGGALGGILDIFAPLAYGQRAAVCAPSKSGKTTVLKNLAQAILRNNPQTEIIIALLWEQPEIIENFKNLFADIKFFCTSFEKTAQHTITVAHLAAEYAKRRVEDGKDVIILTDGVSRLYRAYTSAGKTAVAVSEISAMLYSASDYVEGGSLTLIYTLSEEKNDGESYALFSECANMRLKLSKELASRRIYPAVNIAESCSDREEELLGADELKTALYFRSRLVSPDSEEEIITLFKQSGGKEKVMERFKN